MSFRIFTGASYIKGGRGEKWVWFRHAHESFILTLRYLSRDNSLLIVLQYIDPVLHITLSQALVCVFYSLKTKALYIYQFSKYLMFINNTPTTSNGNASNRYVWNSSILYILYMQSGTAYLQQTWKAYKYKELHGIIFFTHYKRKNINIQNMKHNYTISYLYSTKSWYLKTN